MSDTTSLVHLLRQSFDAARGMKAPQKCIDAADAIERLERELTEQKRICDAMHEDLHSHDERREWAERELAEARSKPEENEALREACEAFVGWISTSWGTTSEAHQLKLVQDKMRAALGNPPPARGPCSHPNLVGAFTRVCSSCDAIVPVPAEDQREGGG